jgi:hypothetical protein
VGFSGFQQDTGAALKRSAFASDTGNGSLDRTVILAQQHEKRLIKRSVVRGHKQLLELFKVFGSGA